MKAFGIENSKLVIMAVVGIAVVIVLFNMTRPAAASTASVIEKQITKAYDFPGEIFVSSEKAEFRAGEQYSQASFEHIVEETNTLINFCCSANLWITCSTTDAVTNNSFKSKIAAVCPADKSTCYIGIDENSIDANGCKTITPLTGDENEVLDEDTDNSEIGDTDINSDTGQTDNNPESEEDSGSDVIPDEGTDDTPPIIE